jgi:amino acid adenylation domain-containing protein
MQTILFEWNGAVANCLEDCSILDLIRAQARRSPHAVAVKFGEENLTYDELDRRSNQLAHYLLAKGCEAETRVGVCLPRALDLIVGLLGILKAGGVCAPLDPAYPPERAKFMLEDAQVSLVLTREGLGVFHEVEQIRLDSDWETISHANSDDPVSTSAGATLANLIYVIYTSGSTGRPKGVALPLDALTNLLNWQLKNFTAQGAVKTLQFTSLNFDVSFQEILSTLCSGGPLVLLTEAQRRDPAQMLHLIEDEKIERLFMPFVALQRLAEAAMQEARFPESLREIVTAGEQLVITPAVGRFFKRLSGCALHNQYGPSESHVVTAHTLAGSPDDWPHLPPIGRPIANARVYLLDQHLNPAPVGVAGELHIGGTGLARGYINGPDQTAERFIPDPFSSEPGARLYRTGDIAQHTPDGLLRFLGRIDQQVKIRGYRIEPGEVEAVLNEHPSVHQGVVTVKDDPSGVKRLVAYVVSRPDDGQAGVAATAGELRRFLGLKLPEYMIPTAFVPMERLPLTPSGKIDRRALPAPGHARPEVNEDYAPPRAPAEEVLAAIWAKVLGVERVGVYDNFFELGGDSLLATQVVSHLREAFKVDLPIRVLFEEANTIAQLAEAVETLARADQGLQRPPLRRVLRDGLLPTSFAQQRLWFLSRLTPDNATYNVPAAVRLRGPLDVSALERSVNEIVRRHEALRTIFDERDGRPIQAPAPESKIPVSTIELQNVAGPERDRDVERHIREEARRPFDLMRGPLLRITLLRLGHEEHVAMLTMSHIVSDGWSVGVLIRELATLYESFANGARPDLNELPIQYADYAVWQREWLRGDRLESLSSYWKRKLSGLATLELPTDRPRPKVMTFEGTVQTLRLPQPLRESLKSLGRDESATLFMTLLAAFKVLLHYFTKQTDIVVGTDVANRNPAETEKLIGFFVNQLVLRTDLSGDPTFRELLARVRVVALEAYAYQEMPFDKLVETLNPPREANRAPLFQVKFVLQNAPTPDLEMAGLRLSLMETHSGTAKFDMLFNMWEMEEGLFGLIEYSTELFDPGSIARLLGHYELILRQAAAAPQRRLSEFEDQLIEADAQRLKAEEQRRRQTQHRKFMKTKPSKFRSGRSKDDEAK